MSNNKQVNPFDGLPTNAEITYKQQPPKTHHDEKVELIKLCVGIFLLVAILLTSLYFSFLGTGDTQKNAFALLAASISGPIGYLIGKK